MTPFFLDPLLPLGRSLQTFKALVISHFPSHLTAAPPALPESTSPAAPWKAASAIPSPSVNYPFSCYYFPKVSFDPRPQTLPSDRCQAPAQCVSGAVGSGSQTHLTSPPGGPSGWTVPLGFPPPPVRGPLSLVNCHLFPFPPTLCLAFEEQFTHPLHKNALICASFCTAVLNYGGILEVT